MVVQHTTPLASTFERIRQYTEAAAAELSEADQTVQSMDDASPSKWHRAHTTWFFDTFVLNDRPYAFRERFPGFSALFNSYYESVGPLQPRGDRGLITRPGSEDVTRYREEVDRAVSAVLEANPSDHEAQMVRVGLQHEQQHLELLLMDIKHALSHNPLWPVIYNSSTDSPQPHPLRRSEWKSIPGGLVTIGAPASGHHTVGDAFSFDNERPAHQVFLTDFEISDTLVTNAQWTDFINDGGYDRHDLWLSEGWSRVKSEGWQSPLYWLWRDAQWFTYSHYGLIPVDPHAPVLHVSHYEADAYARWALARLPTEAEWEHAIRHEGVTPPAEEFGDHPFGISGLLPPATAASGGLDSVFDSAWQWTSSAYLPYPGFQAEGGALGEYNGKFMSNQMVLRGGSAITPIGHTRVSYRNFFPPDSRWVYSGVRLAR
jgi:ergothioneine biosynthesis protein EgtB